MLKNFGRFAFASLVSALCMCSLSLAAPPTITVLEPPGGYVNSFATALSADGSFVVGGCDPDGCCWRHAFRWGTTGGAQFLGVNTFGALGPGCANATGISADGSVVVGKTGLNPCQSFAAGYRWTPAQGMQVVTAPQSSHAYGVSSNGITVVGVHDSNGDALGGDVRAFRWTAAGGFEFLATVEGWTESRAYAANADGSTIVGSIDFGPVKQAYRWDSNVATSLGSLGGTSSQALAVSADGSIIVGGSYLAGGSQFHAFRWSSQDGMQPLEELAGATASHAYSVTADGSVIVGDYSSANGSGAFIWTASLGMVDLATYFANRGVDLSGWTNLGVAAISADGTAIAGSGLKNGQDRGYVVRGLTAQRLYVRSTLTTGNDNGTSWDNAFQGSRGLQNALAVATTLRGNTEIWVAESGGIPYHPDATTAAPNGTGNQSATFQLLNGVAICGGFAGNEPPDFDLSQRDFAAHATVLSGDLADDDSGDLNLGDNSFSVVNGTNTDASAVFDGFTISGGYAPGTPPSNGVFRGAGIRIEPGSPTIRNCTFERNTAFYGGAAYCDGAGSRPAFTNCTFKSNRARRGNDLTSGGAVASFGASPVFRSCRFEENVAFDYGGAIYARDGGEVALIGCDFVRNRVLPDVGGTGGALVGFTTTLWVYNSTFLGNTATSGFACTVVFGATIQVINSVIVGNVGNAPFAVGAVYNAYGTVSLNNCTVAYNTCGSTSRAAGVSLEQTANSHLGLSNCLLWGNVNGNGSGQDAQFDYISNPNGINYNSVQGWVNANATGSGNNADYPDFLSVPSPGPNGTWGDADDSYGDLLPRPGSPAIDSADAQFVPPDYYDINRDGNVSERTPLDLAGNPRFFDITNVPNTGPGDPPHVDRGAYENVLCDECPGEREWARAINGDFEDPFKWTLGVPGPGHRAAFNQPGGPYSVVFNQNRTNASASVRAGDVTFDLNGFTYTLNGSFPEGALTVGESAPTPATQRITEGTVNATGVTIGHEELADGLIDVGAGSVLRAGPHLFVGSAGTGALNIHDGGLVTANTGAVGSLPGSYGSVDITGTSSRLSFLAFCLINNGIVNVGQDATFRTGFGCFIQGQGMLTGSGTVLGDVINIGGIEPGSSPGTLTITGDLIQFSDDPKFGNGAGSLTIELAGDTPALQDHLAVSGLATLGGGLIVERAANFDGPLPQDVEVLSASSINGFFDVAFLPHAGDSQRYLSAQTQAGLRGVGQSVVITSLPLTAFINTDPASPTGINGTPSAAATGDLDGDGDLDVAAVVPRLDGNSQPINGDVVILRNEGLSMGAWQGFAAVQLTGVTGRDPRGIAAADLDGQPGLDLVIADAADDTVSVLLNTGTGAFQPRTTFSVGDEPRAVVVADLDADGYFDVATANTSGGSVSVLRNQEAEEPGGTWAGLGQTLGDQRVDVPVEPSHADPRPVALAAVQLNSDAGEELAVANEGASSITVLRNDSSLRSWFARWYLPPPVRLPTPRPPTSIEPENMDEDKWDDIVYASATGGTAGIILNDRAGADEPMDPPDLIRFRPAVEVPTGSNPTSIVGADLDQDLDTDLAIATTDESSARVVRVLRNDAPINGVVTLSPDQDISAGADPRIVLAGNVDGVEGEPNPSDDLIVLGVGVIASRASKDAGGFGMLTGVPQPDGARVFRNIPPPCAGDANGDNAVNFADITSVVVNWGTSGPPGGAPLPGDADHSGSVNFADITAVLVEWGAVCG